MIYSYDFEKKQFELLGDAPKWEQQCDYDMKGTILGLPINGKGRSILTLSNNYTESLSHY